MKKAINNVWTVKLPSGDVHIEASVPETAVHEFAKGRGKWGDTALVTKEVKTVTVFESIQEVKDYSEYTKVMNDNLKSILDNSNVSRISGIVQYMNNYVAGTVTPDNYTIIPDVASGVLLVQMAEVFEPNFITQDAETQADLLVKMDALYEVVRNQSSD